MTRDPQFGWFDPVKTVTFNNCILLKPLLAAGSEKPFKRRPSYGQSGIYSGSAYGRSICPGNDFHSGHCHMLVFPDRGNGVKYIETAFIDEQPEEKQREWQKAYDYILKKVTFIEKGKQLR